jgi:hypothetical protein
MNRFIFTSLFILGLFLPEAALPAQGSFPLQITVSLPPPYPNRLSDFTDIETSLFVDVFNPSDESYSIILTGRLENRGRGVVIYTNPSNPMTTGIEIGRGNTRLMLEDLEELFDPHHLIFNGASSDSIMRDAALPEGEYTFCLRAFDAFNPDRALSQDPEISFSGCASFPVSLVDPPRINESLCNSYISSIVPSMDIRWTWMRPAFGSENVTFTLRIIEVDPPDRPIDDALLSSATYELYYEDGIVDTYKNLLLPEDVTLEPGRSYVVQVIAEDITGEVRFKNDGKSELCMFHYSEPMLTIGQPRWITESEITFETELDVAIDYEIPFPESSEEELIKDTYIFKIPEGTSPEDAFASGDFIDQNNYYDLWGSEYNPASYTGFGHKLTLGSTYGAKIIISDPTSSDDRFFENGGESDILVFNYGQHAVVSKPEWITIQEMIFEDPGNAELVYRILAPEHTEVSLHVAIKYFVIPEGITAENASEIERNLHIHEAPGG